jgi:DNA-directed RNA polymerase sigma subunit (sigma70/sigma32)
MASRSIVAVSPSPYLANIRTFSLLSAEEERVLSWRWRDRRDIAAAHRLVTSHLGLAVKIAKGHARYGLPVVDLVSEGNVGLILVIGRFDPDLGVRLSTWSMWWIQSVIQDYILHRVLVQVPLSGFLAPVGPLTSLAYFVAIYARKRTLHQHPPSSPPDPGC